MIKYLFIGLFILLSYSANSQEIKIIDGDTIKIDGETIRFSGIDTPETIYFKKYKQLCYLNRKKNYCGEISKVKLIEKIGLEFLWRLKTDFIRRIIRLIYTLSLFTMWKIDNNSSKFLFKNISKEKN